MSSLKFITISGIDGSGKSTQIEMLKSYFKEQGKKVLYFHAVGFSIGNKILKKTIDCGADAVSVTQASFWKIVLRRFALAIDIFRFRQMIRKVSDEIVLSDRYFYDSVVNINYLSRKNKILQCERFIPKPDLAFYLDADPGVIMERDRIPDQGLSYLKAKKRLFDENYARWRMIRINGNAGKEEVFESIIKAVKEKLT